MKYRVEYTRIAAEQLKKLDRKIAALILTYIEEKLIDCDNPRLYGKALQGDHRDIWRYRVGDYRILARIDDDIVLITVVKVGHRNEIYD